MRSFLVLLVCEIFFLSILFPWPWHRKTRPEVYTNPSCWQASTGDWYFFGKDGMIVTSRLSCLDAVRIWKATPTPLAPPIGRAE